MSLAPLCGNKKCMNQMPNLVGADVILNGKGRAELHRCPTCFYKGQRIPPVFKPRLVPKATLEQKLAKISDGFIREVVVTALRHSVKLIDENGIFADPTTVVKKAIMIVSPLAEKQAKIGDKVRTMMYRLGFWKKIGNGVGENCRVEIQQIYIEAIDSIEAA